MATSSEISATSGLSSLEKELVCFICTEVLFQPLTLINCLHTFCGSCLKEWFSHQYKKASQSRSQSTSNPYTCPTCRATVKDARHNATVSTLLDMFLTAHPSRGRAAEEKEEMMQIYKPGDNILPKVEARRRDRRERRHDEASEAHERRMIEEARERSLRDVQNGQSSGSDRLAPSERREHSRSQDREGRRRREQERAERRRRAEAAEAALAAQTSSSNNVSNSSPPPSSPRHPDAVEARLRERTVAHQASLRSLVSASESGTGTGDSLSEARIMQEILAEGLLEGINVDELTEAEQDELSERIAELYRQRHPRREQLSPSPSSPPNRDSTAAIVATSTRSEASERRRRQRSRDSQRTAEESITGTEAVDSLQRPRIPEVNDSLLPPGERNVHRRRASNESRRQASPSRRSPRATSAQSAESPATRSATDLSTPQRGSETSPAERPRRLSDTRRTNTEPAQPSPRASELWGRQAGDGNQSQASSRRRTDSPSRPPQAGESPRPRIVKIQSEAETPSLPSWPAPAELRSDSLPTLATTSSQRPATPPMKISREFEEPSISCIRCSRPDIQYDVHRHCSQCKMDICVPCYRAGRGCNHWFGFGRAAMIKFESSAPERSSKLLELPHVLVGRQYQQPAKASSDPAERLNEGHFCDRCGSFANTCFWSCEYCNEGEWGFCNDCVDTHHCCTHPLLPISRWVPEATSPIFQPPSDYDIRSNQPTLTPRDIPTSVARTTPNHSRSSTSHSSYNGHNEMLDYYPLKISANCDLCGQPIAPSHSRYHCPSHSSSTAKHNLGGYDVCTMCYHNLARSGRVKRDDGPAGWRKCPKGHRMIVIVFEIDSQGYQRRVIVNDLVGGWKCTDEDMAAWKPGSANSTDAAQSPPLMAGKWSWREDASGKRASRARTSAMTALPQAQGMPFPPDGGFGKRSVGLWSYYPEEGEAGKGELMFPKGAEVCEVEDVNGEWWDGVYCGERGVFPAIYVREISG